MCLAIPGRVEQILSDEPLAREAMVSFGGIRKTVNLSFVPDAAVGDYVIVHVGLAISKLDEEAAAALIATLNSIPAVEGTP
ncbi:MAG: HypC/HybG/HupF family hydrogenase formation chaperone [Gammaproteobacteria bacterium]|uniref:HypC/HybG/HupF family hydrogenase formation chaperone n=1 Tax=Pseudomaricurvus alcaniphilus TaxID=1166482 RepID=UPI00140826BC|nr:HypC/HybG/HupF family hydrogenase formation chaperone [Pseudomaricurvus alcaniphilus]MBR9912756.1 HypC/HybG/HupF family hydrogenase formation chaperone [Gammaproteobacteria bacterium]NHN37512.1 HypC/HybG/HupF family hydrogenase formation chaperone [Pseudomaricurvus alcaniphilus]